MAGGKGNAAGAVVAHPFEPVFDANSRVLVLGSFPSEASRAAGFFYGHPRNRFWRVMAAVFGEDVPKTIEEKRAFLLRSRVALWDVAASCEVVGSSDASIRRAVPTDLARIFSRSPVAHVFLNGQKAAALYKAFYAAQTIPAQCLPSTSPANAAWSLERLTAAWAQVAASARGRLPHCSIRDDFPRRGVPWYTGGMSDFESCKKLLEACRAEAAKRLVGQRQVVDGILIALLTGGHALLEGVPGLAKTLAVRTFAEISGLGCKRIQFTPDLLPADVTGTLLYESQSGRFTVRKGPIFTHIVLADEINRSPAKVQSALLEAMAERQVTIGDETYPLPSPFLVLATQNPIEQEGTYNLPEAELDRFLIKVTMPYPTAQEEAQIVRTAGHAADIAVDRILDAEKIAQCRALLDAVTCDDALVTYIVSVVALTRPAAEKKAGGRLAVSAVKKDDISRYVSYGASPRSGIALLQCAKAYALFAGRSFVLPEDVKAAAPAVLRHRLVLSYEAAADGVTANDVIERVLQTVALP